mmetsp:Transcript_39544/g.89185  ORF Transcript_39544/g.89185 Transcript_39544/m.89185 type:complete len:208 (+) Transcript_39544:318-941(+)
MKAISSELIAKILDFGPQELSNTPWAVSRFGVINQPLLDALAAASITKITQFNAQNLNNSAWSMAALGVGHPPLLEAISAASLPKISEFNMQGLANPVWSYDSLGCEAHLRALLDASVQGVPGLVDASGSLSWTDYGGVASTRCSTARAAKLEAVVHRDILGPLLGLLVSLTARSQACFPSTSPLRLKLLRGVHQAVQRPARRLAAA